MVDGGIFGGWLLGLVPSWFSRRKAFETHKKAMNAELSIVEGFAKTFLTAGVMAPSYRLPGQAFEAGYKLFISQARMSEDEAKAISLYSLKVLEINRGLDNANSFRTEQHNELIAEYNRLLLKTESLLNDNLPAAKQALDAVKR